MSAARPTFLDGDASLFRLLVQSVRDYAIFALDPEGHVMSWNLGAERAKGYTASEILGKHFSRFFTEEDRAQDLPAKLLAAAREQGSVSSEGWRVRKDGSRFRASVVITALQTVDGQPAGFAKVTRDVTQQHEAREQAARLEREQAARAALERYAAGLRFVSRASRALSSTLDLERTLHMLADLAVPEVADWCVVDLLEPGGALRRVTVAHADPDRHELHYTRDDRFANASFDPSRTVLESGESIFFPELTEDALSQIFPDADQRALVRQLGIESIVIVPLSGRHGAVGALTLGHATSERRFSDQDVSLLEELGRHAGLAIENARLRRDLEAQNQLLEEQATKLEQQTEELQNQAHHLDELMAELEVSNEELMQRTDEAEAANRAKSEFLATMSHELRTPLNAIFGYADLLDMGLHGPVTPAQREALERIKRNQRALLVLVNDVLNFAKLEAGKVELTMADVSVAEVIGDVAAVIAPQLEKKGLRHEFAPFDDAVRVRGEQERIEQILLNLLTNASKFTPRGGEVVVSVTYDDHDVQLQVRDTGNGIPEEKLQSVFDPFVQIDRQVEDTGERGVGLGLAISRDLAVAMGGTLTAESTLGEGSIFTLMLKRTHRGDKR